MAVQEDTTWFVCVGRAGWSGAVGNPTCDHGARAKVCSTERGLGTWDTESAGTWMVRGMCSGQIGLPGCCLFVVIQVEKIS